MSAGDAETRSELLRQVRHALLDLADDGIEFVPRPERRDLQVEQSSTRSEAQPSEGRVGAAARARDPQDQGQRPERSQQDRSEAQDFAPDPQQSLGLGPARSSETLEEIRADLGECTRCRLCDERRTIVFGEGSPQAPVVFVGEGPGAEEDRTGRPFVGRAGELLTKMIHAIGWQRDDVYICNIVKCRPPGNRTPQLDEVATCRPFLDRQLASIQPKVIVALGKPAASTLLGRQVPITKARGIWQEWNGIPLMPTFHPAYLLRNYTREARQAVWDDLRAVRARVDAADSS